MRARALTGVVGAVAAIGWLAMAPAARAQDVRITAPAPSSSADDAQKPLTSEESDMLGRALLFDPAALASNRPPRTLKLPRLSKSAGLDVKNTDKPDGSSSVAVKQPLTIDTPDIDSNVGADVNLAPQPPSIYQPRGPLPGSTTNDRGSAAAWASVGLPNFASVDARVDPAGDQGKIGGKLSHAVPVGKDLSVTLEDSYSMTESFGGAAIATGADHHLVAGGAAAGYRPGARAGASLRQFEVRQIQCRADRHVFRRRLDHRQQRSRHPPHAQRRPEAARPSPRHHLGDRRRPADREQDHYRRLQAELVTGR